MAESIVTLKTAVIFGLTFFVVAYVTDTALLNLFPAIPHFWQITPAVMAGASAAYTILNRRRAQGI